MTANISAPKSIRARDGTLLKEVSDYKYLGAWVASSMKDFKVRRALAWVAAHKLKNRSGRQASLTDSRSTS